MSQHGCRTVSDCQSTGGLFWHALVRHTCVFLCRPATSYSAEHPDGLEREASFGALAAEADSMEDKLKLVETKRK
jgi:hypothetical protein